MTGYRAFSYDFVKTFPVLSRDFEIEIEVTIYAIDRRVSIRNVVIGYRDRPEGSESKLNTVSDGIRGLMTIGRMFLHHRPLEFFSLLSGILALFAAGFFIPVFLDYLDTGLVRRFPHAYRLLIHHDGSPSLILCGTHPLCHQEPVAAEFRAEPQFGSRKIHGSCGKAESLIREVTAFTRPTAVKALFCSGLL